MFFLKPHYHIDRVSSLSPEILGRLGLDALLLDVDCTLKSYRSEQPEPDIMQWLDDIQASGVRLCLASNGKDHRIRPFADELGIPCMAMCLKPFPFRLRRAIRENSFDRHRTAMIGDQLFADIPAGRLAGLTTIHVTPIRPEEEPIWSRFKRRPEAWLLKLIRPTAL